MWRKSFSRRVGAAIAVPGFLIWLGAGFPARGLAASAQSARPVPDAGSKTASPPALEAAGSAAGQASDQQTTGSINGSVVGPRGGPVIEALVTLSSKGQTVQQVHTTDSGHFSFANVAPGTYWLTTTASGFKSKSLTIIIHAGETYSARRIKLALAPLVTSVTVSPSKTFVAHYQLQHEEKQLVLGFIPNYMVTYYAHTAPLNRKQKFKLTFKTVFNPFTIGLATAFVGGEQAAGMYSGYGSGAEGYAKRFGAAYATLGVGAFVGDAILPSVFKQDPRFYYKGTGSVPSKLLYAITRSFICKGDNGHWEPDYSAILGHFAAGGVANLYLPKQNRKGLSTTLEDGMIGIGFDAFADILQEFVFPKLTPELSHRYHGKP